MPPPSGTRVLLLVRSAEGQKGLASAARVIANLKELQQALYEAVPKLDLMSKM